jgi:8-oxo-dGTP pyrophosphatase MutT (NUDIX family)
VSPVLAALLWILLIVVLVLGCAALLKANRLDRLHVRSDAAAAALWAALDRRAVVARSIAAMQPSARGAALRAAADTAEHASPADREAAENALSRTLGEVGELPAGLDAELADAEQRVVIARRVYNDAVRDTLALRGTRLVRWLRLAGTTALPRYFEIAEEPLRGGVAAAAPVDRPSARVVLLDDDNRVLLFEAADPGDAEEPFWVTVGGGVEDGEEPRRAAVRELHEETGVQLEEQDLVGPVWRRHTVYRFDGTAYASREWYFVARSADPRIDTSGFDDVEAASVRQHRWWTAEELRRSGVSVYPVQLPELLPAVANGWDGVTRTIR